MNRERRKFVSGYLGDMSKAIFAVALASRFFIELPMAVRIVLGVTGVAVFVIAVLMVPEGDNHV